VGAPATIPGVLTVAGLDRKNVASVDASSQGISIGVAAPAENLLGGLPGGSYAEWAGTSGSTPIVSGVAALIRSKWPDMSAEQVINRIVSTAKDAGPPGKDPLYGYGILNAEAALKADVPPVSENPLGTVAEWIRVHRRGNAAPATPQPTATSAPIAAPTLADATVPAAKAPSQRDTAIGAAVVIGFAVLFVAIIAAAGISLRRAARNPALAREEPETGVVEQVQSRSNPHVTDRGAS
jgi:subtilisin family serine protease